MTLLNQSNLLKCVTFFSFLFLLITGCEQARPPMPIPEVDTAAPLVQTVSGWQTFPGRFQAAQQVEIRARVSGYLEKILFQDGQFVTEGDPLFVIEQDPFEIAVRRTTSEYQLAKKDYERAEELFARKVLSKSELDDRNQRMQTAQANYDDAKLNTWIIPSSRHLSPDTSVGI